MNTGWARCAGTCLILAAVGGLSACERVGNPLEALGAKIPPPDEFQVIASKPLQMPPSAALPEPTPGAKSPLAPDPHREARVALLGTEGTVAGTTPSAGEQVLLTSANAAASSSDIRVQLEQDERRARAGEKYEPPTLVELLGSKDSAKVNDKDALDPQVEAERLQREGNATPVDPNAEFVEEQPSVQTEISEYPPGRPQTPFSKDTTIINN
ncbi:MAG: DUF3035 domain-containing protein [Paracoccaceae bacterium]|nr:DUF3035 domain-containing protein [Paracoccaceae bacterium]